jgi:hypothetical protein
MCDKIYRIKGDENQQIYLGLSEKMIQVSCDNSDIILQYSRIQSGLGELEVSNEVGHACLAAVGLRQVGERLAADSALHRRRPKVGVVLVGELGAAQSCFGSKVVALLDQQACDVARVSSIIKVVPLTVYNRARETSGRVDDLSLAISM